MLGIQIVFGLHPKKSSEHQQPCQQLVTGDKRWSLEPQGHEPFDQGGRGLNWIFATIKHYDEIMSLVCVYLSVKLKCECLESETLKF